MLQSVDWYGNVCLRSWWIRFGWVINSRRISVNVATEASRLHGKSDMAGRRFELPTPRICICCKVLTIWRSTNMQFSVVSNMLFSQLLQINLTPSHTNRLLIW